MLNLYVTIPESILVLGSGKEADLARRRKLSIHGCGRAEADLAMPLARLSTRSLTQSILDYPVENGRRYHRFREGCMKCRPGLSFHLSR